MTKTTTEKRFDTVRMMRSARDELNAKTSGMTFEEERAYLRERLRESTRRVAAWPQEAATGDGTDPTGERGSSARERDRGERGRADDGAEPRGERGSRT